jgi:hypothetical protein
MICLHCEKKENRCHCSYPLLVAETISTVDGEIPSITETLANREKEVISKKLVALCDAYETLCNSMTEDEIENSELCSHIVSEIGRLRYKVNNI